MRRAFIPISLIVTVAFGAFAFVAGDAQAGGGGHGGCAPPRDGTDELVAIENSCFTPAVLYVEPGATVEWQQRDAAPHNVTLFGGDVVGGEDALYDGDSVTGAFESPGVYAYYCSVHPSMLGVVVAGDPAGPEFGANLTLQTSKEQPQAIQTREERQPATKAPLQGKVSEPDGGIKWYEAVLGLGLFGGVLVGLVAAGGGILARRSS